MKKKILSALTCLMMCSVFLLSGFTSHAVVGQGDDMLDFYVPYSRPDADGMGYISLVVERDGVYKLETYIWNMQPYDVLNANSTQNASGQGWVIITDNEITVSVQNTSQNAMMTSNIFLLYESNGYTRMDFVKSGTLGYRGSGTEDLYYTIDYKDYGMKIIGYEIGGNAYLSGSTSLDSPNKVPCIHWNEEVGLDVYQDIMMYLVQISSHTGNLSNILLENNITRKAVVDIRNALKLELDSIEQEQMDDFKNNSGVQSDELTSLNQQNQLEKPDVDSVSQQVDSVLDVEMDANYGMLLSSLTNNNRILTMMLVCSAVALISFVLFGKR